MRDGGDWVRWRWHFARWFEGDSVDSRMSDDRTDISLHEVACRIAGTKLAAGLRDDEIAAIEGRFGFVFPLDLRAFLQGALPCGSRWPAWREAIGDAAAAGAIARQFAWPLDGMLFDVEENDFWDPAWGQRPATVDARRQVVSDAVRAAPVLIPVYAHRYMPAEPVASGNPVLSVYQTDIIVYGSNLRAYLFAESDSFARSMQTNVREIRCWTRWMHADWV